MKKFFKALALVLALTLVLGCMPVAAADAKPMESKTLYIDGAQGKKADGTQSKFGYRVAIRKLAGITKADAENHEYAVKAIADEAIAHATKYYVYADSIGTTKVTLTVDGKDVDVTLNVKKNATADTLVITGLEDGGKYVVGKSYEVTLPRANKDTDVRALEIADATVTAGAKARVWNVTFPKAGEYTVKFWAYQSKTFTKATAEKTIKVNAALPTVEDAVQTAAATIKVTFSDDVTGLKAEDFDIYYLNAVGTKIRDKVIKSVDPVKDDAKSVTITVYNAFTKAVEYFVAFGDSAKSFTAASNTEADIARFEIVTKDAIVNTFANVSYKFYNAGDMLLDVAPTVTLEKVSGSEGSIVLGSTNQVYLAKVGDSIVVKAYYTTVDTTTWQTEKHYCGEATITAVNELSDATIFAKGVTATTAAITKDTKLADSVKIDDDAYFHVLLRQTKLDGSNADTSINGAGGNYKLYSADEKKAVVVDNTNWKIVGISAGTATLVLEQKMPDGKYSVVAAFQVEILAKKALKDYTVEVSKQSLNLASAEDELTITVKEFDQYGDAISGVIPTIAVKDICGAATGCNITFAAKAGATGVYEATVKGSNILGSTVETGKSATLLLETIVKINNNDVKKDVVFAVGNYNAAANGYTLVGAKNFDTTVSNKIDKTTVDLSYTTIKLVESVNNFVTVTTGMAFVDKTPTTNASTGNAVTLVYTITGPDGIIKASNDFINVAGANVQVRPFFVTGGAISKLKAGSYVITAYKQEAKSTGTFVTTLATTSFTVTDAQITPVVKQIKETTDLTSKEAVFAECFEIYFNGEKVTFTVAEVTGQQDATSGAWVITGAKVKVPYGKSTDTFTIAVNGLPAVVK